jgi:amino acid transporter
VTGLTYLITLFYTAPDLSSITATRTVFPLAQIYYQATGSRAATVGLLIVALIPTILGATGAYAIAGRQGWSLAREKALPFSSTLVRLNERTNAPLNVVLLAGVLTSALGTIYFASATAFNALTGSFVVFSSLSYLAALVPHVLSNRRHMKSSSWTTASPMTANSATSPTRGYFRLPDRLGLIICVAACIYLAAFVVIFCFPPSLPVSDAGKINYTGVIVGGWTIITAAYGGMRMM